MRLTVLFALLFTFCNAAMAGRIYNITIVFDDTGVDLKKDVRFFLYTRSNPESPQQLWVDDELALQNSAYNASKATKFMTHGWLNTYQGRNCETVRKAFLARDDYNVIVVDWGNVAKLPYLIASARLRVCAGHVARMLGFLAKQGGVGGDPSDMSLVGHSLGAHLMGLAGYQAADKVGHVVGLDPARLGFQDAGPGRGISPADAQLVEIVHTNANDLGLARPAGHLDYYPNDGGEEQPGCGEDPKHYCAHDRAYVYYAEALTRLDDGLLAVRCKDSQEFRRGECDDNDVVPFARWSQEGKVGKSGSYYLRTADKAPFGLGVEGTKPATQA